MTKNKANTAHEPVELNLVAKMIYDPVLRKEIVTKSFYWFFHYYFFAHVKYQTAEFQKEIFNLAQNGNNDTLVITAFRGSGKTTLITQAFVIWSIIGMIEKKYVVILTQTMEQARALLVNIRYELENNPLLRLDLGPFKEESGEWRSSSLVLNKYGAKITVASIEQGIRGTKYGANRPDLIIADDLEDINSVRTKESRDKIYTWLMGDVMHLGDRNTKIIIVGNLLHQDSVMMRLKNGIEEGKIKGIYRQYPAIYLGNDGNEHSMWPGKYPTVEDVRSVLEKTGDNVSFSREMLLEIVDDLEPPVDKAWLHFYDTPPGPAYKHQLLFTAIAIDPAIGQKETSSKTAIVTAKVYYDKDTDYKIYICPHPVNDHLTFPETIDKIKELVQERGDYKEVKILVEEVAYQASLTQQLKEIFDDDEQIQVLGVSISGSGSKRDRLISTTNLIQKGMVVFPQTGCKELLNQITNFGIVSFLDLADSFSMLINTIIMKNLIEEYEGSNIRIVQGDGWDDDYDDDEFPIKNFRPYTGRKNPSYQLQSGRGFVRIN